MSNPSFIEMFNNSELLVDVSKFNGNSYLKMLVAVFNAQKGLSRYPTLLALYGMAHEKLTEEQSSAIGLSNNYVTSLFSKFGQLIFFILLFIVCPFWLFLILFAVFKVYPIFQAKENLTEDVMQKALEQLDEQEQRDIHVRWNELKASQRHMTLDRLVSLI